MSVLLLLVALIAPGIAQSSSCQTPTGPCPCPVRDFTTKYLPFSSNTRDNKPLDNVCHSFFPLPGGDPCTYVAYFTPVYTDGSSAVISFIVTCNSSSDYIFSSPNCTFLESKIGIVGQTTVKVRHIINGDCPKIAFPAIATNPCTDKGSLSDLAAIQQVLNNNGYGCTSLHALQARYPSQCVAQQPSSNTGGNCTGPCYDNYPTNYYPSYNYYPPNTYSPSPSSCDYYK